MNQAARCDQQVPHGSWGRTHQCVRRGIIPRNGKHWCKQHDPLEVERRRRASQLRWDDNHRKNMLGYVAPSLKAALERIAAGEVNPQKIAREALRRFVR